MGKVPPLKDPVAILVCKPPDLAPLLGPLLRLAAAGSRGLLFEAAVERRWGVVLSASAAYWLISQPAQSVRLGLIFTGRPALVLTCTSALGLLLLFLLLAHSHFPKSAIGSAEAHDGATEWPTSP